MDTEISKPNQLALRTIIAVTSPGLLVIILFLLAIAGYSLIATVFVLTILVVGLGLGVYLVLPLRASSTPRTELGIALVSGIVIALSVMLLQVQTGLRDEKAIRSLRETEARRNLLLTLGLETELEGIDLRARDLQGAYLRNKNLSYANLKEADLASADLSGSLLVGTDLQEANLHETDLEGVVWSTTTMWPDAYGEDLLERSSVLQLLTDDSVETDVQPWFDFLVGELSSGEVIYRVESSGRGPGWAPKRPVFRYSGEQGEDTADIPYVTFNSLIGTPSYGDERAFLDVRNIDETQAGSYHDVIEVVPGQILRLRAYIHNNANAGEGEKTAIGTRFRVFLPTASATALRAIAYITADNSDPLQISDGVQFNAPVPVRLEFLSGSAVLISNQGSYPLPDDVIRDGALIGPKEPNGTVEPGFDNEMTVQLSVRVLEE